MNRWLRLASVLVSGVLACAPLGPDVQASAGPPAGSTPGGAWPGPPGPSDLEAVLVASTLTGALALVDPASGAVLSSTAALSAPLRDVEWDPVEHAVALVAGDDEETSSEWLVAPLRAQALGEPYGVASTDGRGRLQVVPEGLVLFENGSGGPGWRYLPRDGAPAKSVGAPEPRSPAILDAQGRVCALAWSKESLSIRCAPLGSGGFDPAEELVGAPSLVGHPTARLVGLEPPLVVDCASGLLTPRALATGEAWPAALPFAVERVDDALQLADGAIVALVTPGGAPGAPPAALVRLDLALHSVAWLGLSAPAVLADTFYRRALAARGERVFVALDDRVVAVDLGSFELDPTFNGVGIGGPITLAP